MCWRFLNCGAYVGLTWLLAGCGDTSPLTVPTSIEQQLKTFIEKKETQARLLAKTIYLQDSGMGTSRIPHPVAPEVWPYFAAGKKGNWAKADKLYRKMAGRSHHFDLGEEVDERLVSTWQPVNETYWVLRELATADPESFLRYGRDILASVPPGGIYFGGTDAGRFTVTFLSESHVDGKPFFVLTQNALTDSSYLEYLRSMYGAEIHVPTPGESQTAFADYLEDAKRRYELGQLKPGEEVTVTNGIPSVQGCIAIMEINARLLWVILQTNPRREVCFEGTYLPDWIYSNLVPQGVPFKVARQPISALPDDILDQNRAWWEARSADLLGEGVDSNPTWVQVVEIARRTFLSEEERVLKSQSRWRVDDKTLPPHSEVCVNHACQRTTMARVFSWRANETGDEESKTRLRQEADLAFRQAFALCPNADDVVYSRCAAWLGSQRRWDDLKRVLDFLEEMTLPQEANTLDWIQRSRDWMEQQRAAEG